MAIVAGALFLEAVSLDYAGWYHDSYHYWQIAIYTLHIGLVQDPPRMWGLNKRRMSGGLRKSRDDEEQVLSLMTFAKSVGVAVTDSTMLYSYPGNSQEFLLINGVD